MAELTTEGARAVDDLAARHGVSADAVITLARALVRGGGRQAQFTHPELGGMGQWSQGGMTMVGDMFNTWLQAKVDALCQELSGHLARTAMFAPSAPAQRERSGGDGVSFAVAPSAGGWPAGLGHPASTGAQNDLRYAIFPDKRRLAIAHPGGLNLYDTADHVISGVSQQQGGGQTLTFTSQHGVVRVDALRAVRDAGPPAPADGGAAQPADRDAGPPPAAAQHAPAAPAQSAPPASAQSDGVEAVFAALERLAELHQRGVLTDDEFSSKKIDLLSRI